MDNDILSVRFLLDANPVSVGDAVSRALVCGQPPKLHASDGLPRLHAKGAVPLPHPISEEWARLATRIPKQMQPDAIAKNALLFREKSFYMGLRPLACNDHIYPHPYLPGYCVSLATGLTSTLLSSEVTDYGSATQNFRWTKRQFRTAISCTHISAAVSGVVLAGTVPITGLNDLRPDSWIEVDCEVRPVSTKRTEIVRYLVGGNSLLEAASFAAFGQETPSTWMLRMVSFMLEMETRAWLDCLGFRLAAVWRGTRCTQEWAAPGNLLTVGSYVFCVGHAAASEKERRQGPRFDTKLASSLSSLLPKDPRTSIAEHLDTRFIEGNVDVESFAALLDRVCRRAHDGADIYRRFVDLGSGHGLAVLTAHLLFPFRGCTGIELNPEAMASARELTSKYTRSRLAGSACSLADVRQLFVEGDFLTNLEWSDASIVFANCVCWPKDLIREVGLRALRLHSGAVLMLAARQLPIEQAMVEAFDVRGEAVLMSFSTEAISIWVYQRR